jgi:FixJ family two-component response regulator
MKGSTSLGMTGVCSLHPIQMLGRTHHTPKGIANVTEHVLVSIVDDDESVRESLPDLLKVLGYSVQTFSSAEDFLASDYVRLTRCLILDVSMPGMSGPDLRQELARRRQQIPIVFITAHREETMQPRLVQQGAAECLLKPFSDTELRNALDAALRANGPSALRP